MSKTIRTPQRKVRHTNLRTQTASTMEGFTAEELRIKTGRVARFTIDRRREGDNGL